MKAPINYYGAKGRLAPWIASLFPKHEVYLEPFAGSAAVLFAKTPCTHEIINDLDGEVVNFFKVLRDKPEQLVRACRLTPYARDEFLAAAKRGPHTGDVEWARRWWVRLSQSHACLVTPWASFSVSVARGSNKANTARALIERMEAAADRLAMVTIENRDAVEIVEKFGREEGTVIYVDPPYLGTTRQLKKNKKAREYASEMIDEEAHRRLAAALRQTTASVFLSGYPSPLYEELYDGWARIERRVHNPSSNLSGKAMHGTEVIWSNRPLLEQLELVEEVA